MTTRKQFEELSAVISPQPRFNIPPMPRSVVATSVEENLASEFHKRLAAWIERFDKSLDQQHEVGVLTFGQTTSFKLEAIGYSNPSLILFKGKSAQGHPVELIQHVSQINMVLTSMKRLNPKAPKTPIGFQRAEDQ